MSAFVLKDSFLLIISYAGFHNEMRTQNYLPMLLAVDEFLRLEIPILSAVACHNRLFLLMNTYTELRCC